VIFVGGDREVKGLAGVLRAMKILEKLKFKVELMVMGKMRASSTLAGVKFLGEVDPESKLFEESWKKADVYVNNSRCEGCPLAVGEAAVAGLGLCLPALPILKGLFRKNASYHQVGNEAQLVRSILFWAYNPELLKEKSRKNKELMRGFSKARFELRWKDVFEVEAKEVR
jgi:glycosyltransferase involved in cell wall biosynthesis